MRAVVVFSAIALACGACVAAAPGPAITEATSTVPPNEPTCRDYTAIATIDGNAQQIVGRAGRQPDGSWRIVEGPPERPDQYATVYAPPPYAYYPYYDPWLWGPPIGLSIGTFFLIDGHHHLHDGRWFTRSFGSHGFAGFAHGSMGRMRHG